MDLNVQHSKRSFRNYYVTPTKWGPHGESQQYTTCFPAHYNYQKEWRMIIRSTAAVWDDVNGTNKVRLYDWWVISIFALLNKLLLFFAITNWQTLTNGSVNLDIKILM
jgi:hypothetical protein